MARKAVFHDSVSGAYDAGTATPLTLGDASFGTPAPTWSTVDAIGSSGLALQSDAEFALFDASVASTQAFGDTAAAGTAAFAARRDHKHAMPADPFNGATAGGDLNGTYPYPLVNDAIGGGKWTIVKKTGDESVSANTTTQDDDELFFTATNGAIYEIEAVIIYASPLSAGTPDIKVAFGEDTTVRGSIQLCGINAVDSTALSILLTTTNASTALGTAAAKRSFLGRGHHAGAGGTFKFKWAQQTSDANPTTVYAGSLLRYRRVI